MKKIIVPVLGLLFALTARAEGPSIEERLQRLEVDVQSIKQSFSAKVPVQGDVVVSYDAAYVKGGQCGSLEAIARYTKDAAAAKVLKVLDCRQTEGVTSYYKAKFYLVQFGDSSIGLFAEKFVTPL